MISGFGVLHSELHTHRLIYESLLVSDKLFKYRDVTVITEMRQCQWKCDSQQRCESVSEDVTMPVEM